MCQILGLVPFLFFKCKQFSFKSKFWYLVRNILVDLSLLNYFVGDNQTLVKMLLIIKYYDTMYKHVKILQHCVIYPTVYNPLGDN